MCLASLHIRPILQAIHCEFVQVLALCHRIVQTRVETKMRGHICFAFSLLLIPAVVCTDSHLQNLERMVEKLQDTVLSVSTQNAKYQKIIEGLTEKVFDQEKRLENLEKNCKKDNFFPEMKTKKTRVVQNLGNDHHEGLDAKKTMPLVRNLQKTPSKRVTSGHGKHSLSSYFFTFHFCHLWKC